MCLPLAVLLFASLASQTHQSLLVSSFPMCNTESDPHCVLIGSKLAGLLTAKCMWPSADYIGSGFQSLIILYNQSAMCACVMHALGIGPSQQRLSPVAVSSASDEDDDDDPPLKKLCVSLYAPEYTRMRPRTPKFIGRASH